MTKYKYNHHWFKDFHSTRIEGLPHDEDVVAVYDRHYWETFSLTRGISKKLKRDSRYFSYVRLREQTPNVFGEGQTMDSAVDSLVDGLLSNGT